MKNMRCFLVVLMSGFLLIPFAGYSQNQLSNPTKSTKNAKKKNVPFKKEKPRKDVNMLEVPYISTYRIEPILKPSEEMVLQFYVTDWNQEELRLASRHFYFEIEVQYGTGPKSMKKIVRKDVPAGDHSITIGKLPEGEYEISLKATDRYGRVSHVLYNEFLVRSAEKSRISEKETYRMTEADLKKYKISNTGNHGKFHLVDVSGESVSNWENMVLKSSEKVTPPEDGYVICVSANKDEITFGNWKWCKVKYGSKYDRGKVFDEARITAIGINELLNDVKAKGFRKLVMLPGTYRIAHHNPIQIPDRFTLDLNGATIKLNQFVGNSAMMVMIDDKYDSHLINGIVEGDYFEHEYSMSDKNSEWVCGVNIAGSSKYCSMEDLTVRYFPGYGVCSGSTKTYVWYSEFGATTPGTIDRKTGEQIPTEGLSTTDFFNIKSYVPTKYVAISKYLGYQSMGADGWNVIAHFYDEKKKYITSIEGFQYRIIRIPENAEHLRVTIYGAAPKGLTLNHFKVPWNCTFRNLKIQFARCVGMAQSSMRNFLVENCEFTYNGESGAFCAYDAEDGWDMMQDATFRKNTFKNNYRNDFLTCAGWNFVYEENEGNIYIWARSKSYVIRNNKGKTAVFGAGDFRNRTMMPRIENNDFSGRVSIGDGDEKKPVDWYITMSGPIEYSNFYCAPTGYLSGVTVKDREYQCINAINSTFDGLKETGVRNIIKSKISNSSLRLYSQIPRCTFTDSDISNTSFMCWNVKSATTFSRCKITDFSISAQPSDESVYLFENCTINTKTKPLITMCPAGFSEIKFVNCTILTGEAPLIRFSEQNGERGEPSKIIFENCQITAKADLIEMGRHVSKHPLEISAVKCKVSGPVLDASKKPTQWKIEGLRLGTPSSSKKEDSDAKKGSSTRKKR